MCNAGLFVSEARVQERSGASLVPCELREKCGVLNPANLNFCLYVARMSRTRTNSLFDQYEQDVDEIIAACRGDLRGAVKALMLINEQLEQTLQQLSAVLIEKRMRIGRTASCTDRLEILALSYQRDGGSLAEIFSSWIGGN
jgi:hypothetical protein